MNRPVLLVALALAVVGCTSNDAPYVAPTQPLGDVDRRGQTPNIGDIQAGQTSQLNASEKAAIRSDLQRSSAAGRAQQAGNNEAVYRGTVAELRREAAQTEAARLRSIANANREGAVSQ